MADKFLVIDGSSLIHRAFFALPPLMNSKGLHTGAVYGLCNMLLKLLEDLKPKYMAVAFDKSRKTFRSRVYADYKAQRKPTPSELSEQFPLAITVLESLGIRTLELDDYEADDIIGTLVSKAPEGVEVIIITGDRDELQLVNSRTNVYYTKKGISEHQVFDENEFAAVYEGLEPKQLIDLKGLMGDASDNIPGVPGVGPKTALKLIKEYGTVEEVIANIDKVKGKALKAKLEANKDSALLSKQLATICLEAPVDTAINLYELAPVKDEAESVLADLEFRNMYRRFAEVLGGGKEPDNLFSAEEMEAQLPEVRLAAKELPGLLAKFSADAGPVAFIATIGGNLPELQFEQIEIFLNDTRYILAGADANALEVKDWLGDAKALKQTIDAKEIYKCCLCIGIEAQGIIDDVALAAYLADPGHGSYALTDLGRRYLGSGQKDGAALIAMLAAKIREILQVRKQTELYEQLELPLAAVLAKMEYFGITPDTELLDQLNEDMMHRIAGLEARAMQEAGETFNLKSPKQLGHILFEKLGLPVIKKTKTGYSTDVKVLEELEGKHPLITTILEHRKLAKLQSTYLEGLKPLVNPKTGRIHTHFQQTVTVTGRLSSTDPNLQNIPTRTEEGREIRRIFIPGKGFTRLMSCDYSQVELRILACIAQDNLLLESFRHGQDVHARTAAEVFGVPLAEVTPAMRSRAKAVNFGIVYGISDYGLARQVNVSRKEAAGFIESYFSRYTGVKKYMEDIVAKAREQGYVSTLMGRRRYLPDINNRNYNLRSFAERTAINTPIQGTAADIMKKAMLAVAAALKKAGLKTRILLQVHDELVLEVPEEEADIAAELVQHAMEGAASLEIPLLAEVKFGSNWAETK